MPLVCHLLRWCAYISSDDSFCALLHIHSACCLTSSNTCLPPPAVYFPAADEGWLDWATGLTSLQRLHLTAALLRLQPEDGLQCLLRLRRHLRSLRLDGCMLLTDEGVPLLAQLRCSGGWAMRMRDTALARLRDAAWKPGRVCSASPPALPWACIVALLASCTSPPGLMEALSP